MHLMNLMPPAETLCFLSFIHVEDKNKLTIKIGLLNFAFLHDAKCSNQYQNDENSKLQSTRGIGEYFDFNRYVAVSKWLNAASYYFTAQ